MTLHFVQFSVSLPAVIRHLKVTGRQNLLRNSDEGLLLKAALNEAFGQKDADGQQIWPKPFQIVRRLNDGTATAVAYSPLSAEGLKQAWQPMPSLAPAFDLKELFGYEMTEIPAGTKQRFSICFCPMVSTYGDRAKGIKPIQLDAYRLEHLRAEREGLEPRVRGEVYLDYVRSRLEPAVGLESVYMGGFTLAKVAREKPGTKGDMTIEVPIATVHGQLQVTDPAAFHNLLRTGIGKRRTYGLGMILLGASAMAARAA